MKFSLSWLRDYIELSVDRDALFHRLTMSGTEVEHFETRGIESNDIVVAQILDAQQHPNADRLKVCRVNDGKEERQIVCGATNYKVGDKVPLALPGAELPGGLKIKESKLRGELSQGMMCSGKELGMGEDQAGLLILAADAPLGKKLHEVIPTDTLFDIEITPNRPDLLSYLGLAREIAAIGAGKLKERTAIKLNWPSNPCAWKIELPAKDAGPFYSGVHLGEVKVGPSPAWLQEKIEATGHRPVNNVVDITNLVMWETGQPLHAFDAVKLAGKTIFVRWARPGESILALDHKNYALTGEDLVIADERNPVVLGGIIGGEATGVSAGTTEVLLEAAWFNPQTIRRTSRRLGVSSDGCYRWERRVDPGSILAARDRAVQLLQELCGAKILAAPLVEGAVQIVTREIKLRPSRVEKIIGTTIAPEKTERGLTALGLKKLASTADATTWQTPSFRYDLEREIDLIEEVARLHGMENVPVTINYGLHLESDADRAHDKLQVLRQTLAARGWDECVTDSLVDGGWIKAFQPDVFENAVKLSNPLNEFYTHLRPNLKNSLQSVGGKNWAKGNRTLRLFEIGRVYNIDKVNRTTIESMHLGLFLAGSPGLNPWEKENFLDLFNLKGITDLLENHFGLKSYVIEPKRERAPEMKADHFYAELSLDKWLTDKKEEPLYRTLPQYPAVRRDVAVVVEESMPHATVLKAIESAKIKELEKIELFDVFVDADGKKIPKEKKSLAYALTYRSGERTLTEEEVNAWDKQLRERLKKELGCSFRET